MRTEFLLPGKICLESPAHGIIYGFIPAEIGQVIIFVCPIRPAERISIARMTNKLSMCIAIYVVERCMPADIEWQFYIEKCRSVHIVVHVVAVGTMEEIKVVARHAVLLRILHPPIFPVIIRIDARNRPVHVGRGIVKVADCTVKAISEQSSTHFNIICNPGTDIGPERKTCRFGIVHNAGITHIRKGNKVFGTLAGAAGLNGMLLVDTGAVHGPHPVRVRISHIIGITGSGYAIGVTLFLPPEIDHRLGENRRSTDVFRRFIHQEHVVGIIGNQLDKMGGLLKGSHTIILH